MAALKIFSHYRTECKLFDSSSWHSREFSHSDSSFKCQRMNDFYFLINRMPLYLLTFSWLLWFKIDSKHQTRPISEKFLYFFEVEYKYLRILSICDWKWLFWESYKLEKSMLKLKCTITTVIFFLSPSFTFLKTYFSEVLSSPKTFFFIRNIRNKNVKLILFEDQRNTKL